MVTRDNIRLFIDGIQTNNPGLLIASAIGLKNTDDESHIPILIDALKRLNDSEVILDEIQRKEVNTQIISAIDTLSRF